MARIHRANLVNFGILPLVFVNREDYAKVTQGADIRIPLTEITPGGVTNIEIAGVGVLPVRMISRRPNWTSSGPAAC